MMNADTEFSAALKDLASAKRDLDSTMLSAESFAAEAVTTAKDEIEQSLGLLSVAVVDMAKAHPEQKADWDVFLDLARVMSADALDKMARHYR